MLWLLALGCGGVAAAEEIAEVDVYPVAGVDSSQRPAGGPTIPEFVKDAAWYDRALTGVVEPYPHSLRFLEDQGAWHTPFDRPGMTGPYDIRGWHLQPQKPE